MENRYLIIAAVLTMTAVFVFGCAHRPVKETSDADAQRKMVNEKAGQKQNQTLELSAIKSGKMSIAELEKWKVGIGTNGKGIRIEPLNPIRFAFDEYALTDKSREILKESAEWLKRYQNLRVLIEGHCDKWGPDEYNLALGDRRAKATWDYLANLGIDAKRIITVSHGKGHPADPGHNRNAWAKNRRAELVVVSD